MNSSNLKKLKSLSLRGILQSGMTKQSHFLFFREKIACLPIRQTSSLGQMLPRNDCLFLITFCFFLLSSCDKASEPVATQNPILKDSVIAIPFPPKFISTNYIELDKIERISKFRSGIGHDYRDEAESCRSMKHYYQPKNTVDWSLIKIISPVSGKVVRIFDEWAGTQVQIQPNAQLLCTVIIFHIALKNPLNVGDSVSVGQLLGTHIGSQTMSDIAVAFSVQNKWKLLSYFDVMTDSLFQQYVARGISSRDQFIISKEARDADPLNCSGETFGSSGTLENWVILK